MSDVGRLGRRPERANAGNGTGTAAQNWLATYSQPAEPIMQEKRNTNDQNRDDQLTKPDPIVQVDDRGGLSSTGATSTDDQQPSALGGDVATRSGVEEDQSNR